jgi:hypothetical protein
MKWGDYDGACRRELMKSVKSPKGEMLTTSFWLGLVMLQPTSLWCDVSVV